MKYLYIVAAAGTGKRMGLDTPKQFLEYNEEPIFIKTLKTINNVQIVTDIIVVTGEEFVETVKNHCKEFGISKLKSVIVGGKERQDSIYNVLKTLENPEKYIIAVQDGVRPFIKDKFIIEAYKNLDTNKNLDGVVIGMPVKDTVKIVNQEGFILDTPVRSTLYLAQTPQVFKGEILVKAYEEADKNSFIGTDDSSLVERINGKIKILKGSYDNIKITTIEDLLYFK